MCPANRPAASCDVPRSPREAHREEKGIGLSPLDRRPWQVLVVDDNRGDSDLLCMALLEWESEVSVHVVEDGDLALKYLRSEWPYCDARLPDLVLLDLHLPRKDGIEVLSEMRRDPELRNIPVVIMTSSDSRSDVVRAYGSNVNSFITKSADAGEFFSRMRALERYWFHTVQLPSDEKLS